MCNCLCSVIVLCGMMTKGREKVKPGADGRTAINSTICLLNIGLRTAEGFGI